MELPGIQNQQISSNSISPAAKAATDQPVAKRSEVIAEPVKVASIEHVDIGTADEKRLNAIKESLRQAFKNVYAVSDRSVTIYKDMSGQYITRYKNLRDGTMTYIPEPEILKHINAGGYFSLKA